MALKAQLVYETERHHHPIELSAFGLGKWPEWGMKSGSRGER
jgi:hypothetical protein